MSEVHYTLVKIVGPNAAGAYAAVHKSEHYDTQYTEYGKVIEEVTEEVISDPNVHLHGLCMRGQWSGLRAIFFVKKLSLKFATERFKLSVEGPPDGDDGLSTFQGSLVIENGRIFDVQDRDGLTKWEDGMNDLLAGVFPLVDLLEQRITGTGLIQAAAQKEATKA